MTETLSLSQLEECFRLFYRNRNSRRGATPAEYRMMARHYLNRIKFMRLHHADQRP